MFALIYLYTAELYPTEIRSTAVGLCSTFARIGGVAAPQVCLLMGQVCCGRGIKVIHLKVRVRRSRVQLVSQK